MSISELRRLVDNRVDRVHHCSEWLAGDTNMPMAYPCSWDNQFMVDHFVLVIYVIDTIGLKWSLFFTSA